MKVISHWLILTGCLALASCQDSSSPEPIQQVITKRLEGVSGRWYFNEGFCRNQMMASASIVIDFNERKEIHGFLEHGSWKSDASWSEKELSEVFSAYPCITQRNDYQFAIYQSPSGIKVPVAISTDQTLVLVRRGSTVLPGQSISSVDFKSMELVLPEE